MADENKSWIKRHPWITAAIAGIVVILLIGLAFLIATLTKSSSSSSSTTPIPPAAPIDPTSVLPVGQSYYSGNSNQCVPIVQSNAVGWTLKNTSKSLFVNLFMIGYSSEPNCSPMVSAGLPDNISPGKQESWNTKISSDNKYFTLYFDSVIIVETYKNNMNNSTFYVNMNELKNPINPGDTLVITVKDGTPNEIELSYSGTTETIPFRSQTDPTKVDNYYANNNYTYSSRGLEKCSKAEQTNAVGWNIITTGTGTKTSTTQLLSFGLTPSTMANCSFSSFKTIFNGQNGSWLETYSKDGFKTLFTDQYIGIFFYESVIFTSNIFLPPADFKVSGGDVINFNCVNTGNVSSSSVSATVLSRDGTTKTYQFAITPSS